MVFLLPAIAVEGVILKMQIDFKYTQNCIRYPFISTLRAKKQKTKKSKSIFMHIYGKGMKE